jgi:hypothetical protein
MQGSINRRITIHTSPGVNNRTYSPKLTKAKRAGVMVQIVEHLPKQAQDPEFKPSPVLPTTAATTKNIVKESCRDQIIVIQYHFYKINFI